MLITLEGIPIGGGRSAATASERTPTPAALLEPEPRMVSHAQGQ
ncbi:MAG: hypothetical protein ACREK5_01790 [Gemmatimonadota bacterium]